MTPTDAILALVASMRGSRPQSLNDGEAEDVLNIALALMVELSASNDRIDRLERIIAEDRGLSVEDLREIRYDGAIAAERGQANEAMQARVLRIMLDPRTATHDHPARSGTEPTDRQLRDATRGSGKN